MPDLTPDGRTEYTDLAAYTQIMRQGYEVAPVLERQAMRSVVWAFQDDARLTDPMVAAALASSVEVAA